MTPSRTRDKPLHRAEILAAALELIDREGIDGFSMRKLGRALHVDPMAIYHHVPTRAALFDGIVELLWQQVEVDVSLVRDEWRDGAAAVMRSLRNVLRAHPNAVGIIGTRPANTPALFAVVERLLDGLVTAGFAPAEALRLGNCLTVFTVGHALAEVGEPIGGSDAPDQGVVLAELVRHGKHPHLASAVAKMPFDAEPDIAFEAGLHALLNGWQL